MNVPSIRVLERVGFDSALDTAANLLGVPPEERLQRNFVNRYPVGLGVVQVSPLHMAKAFSTLANLGREVTPIAVRYIEDRNGEVIAEPEADLRRRIQQAGGPKQIVTPQAAYVITDVLQTTVQSGTLRYAQYMAEGFDQPTAGKTGTTQNWADAWAVGFTPYYTTATWMGFDRGEATPWGSTKRGRLPPVPFGDAT